MGTREKITKKEKEMADERHQVQEGGQPSRRERPIKKHIHQEYDAPAM